MYNRVTLDKHLKKIPLDAMNYQEKIAFLRLGVFSHPNLERERKDLLMAADHVERLEIGFTLFVALIGLSSFYKMASLDLPSPLTLLLFSALVIGSWKQCTMQMRDTVADVESNFNLLHQGVNQGLHS